MLEDLQHRWTLLRVEVQRLRDHIVGLDCAAADPLLAIVGLDLGQELQHFPAEVGLEGLEIMDGRRASPGDYPLYLVQGRMPWEHRLAREELPDEAPKAPNIRSRGVLLRPQQYLGCAIPPRGDILSEHCLLLGLCLCGEGAYEPKIADLGIALLIDEYIGGLDIAVDEPRRVEVVEGLGDLVHDELLVLLLQHLLPDQRVEVDVHVLEQQVDVLLVQRTNHLLQAYYVRVPESLQEDYLTVRALGVRGVLKSVEVFL